MSKEAFTQGPWHFLESHNHEDEFSCCNPLTICSDGNDDLANIYSSADSTVSISREQAIANAHLIAAAPELYEALEKIVIDEEVRLEALNPKSPAAGFCAKRLAKARAALKKARGES